MLRRDGTRAGGTRREDDRAREVGRLLLPFPEAASLQQGRAVWTPLCHSAAAPTLPAESSTDHPPSIRSPANTLQFSKHFEHTVSLDPPSNAYL